MPKTDQFEAGGGTIVCDADEVPYVIFRTKRRTVGITVHPDRSVVVRAPLRVSLSNIRTFVHARAAWIGKARRHFEQRPPKKDPPAYHSGEMHRYLGQEYRLVAAHGRSDAVELLVGCLCVTTRMAPTPERVRHQLDRWYREQAEVVFGERLAAGHRLLAGEGISYPELRIRKMTSRWGSCSLQGRINLNLWLVQAPVDCIDYVVVHELCHFKVKSHGPKFWRMVGRYMPDYAERRKRLNAGAG
ncbi:MAG TPA: SprT family zinc-dependent metalloprotease [Candidatus Deferrimicrobiaceae bacterium]|jgi:hypothetical protein